MKKRLVVAMGILPFLLTACSFGNNGNKDAQLLDEYYTKKFTQPFVMNSLTHNEYNSEAVGNGVDVPGLKYTYTVHFSFSVPSEIHKSSNGVRMTHFEVDPSALAVNPVDIPVGVTASADCGFRKQYTKTLQYKSYTDYLAELFSLDLAIEKGKGIMSNKQGVSVISANYSSSGGSHHHDYTLTINLNTKTYKFKLLEYQTNGFQPGSFNETEYIATYYFGNNPRIEGLTTGTYYIGSGAYESSDKRDKKAFSHSEKLNNLFKRYADSRFITQLS